VVAIASRAVTDIGPSIVAALSGLAGAALGGLATYQVARQQILATRDAAEAQAQREAVLRRRERYASFIAAASSVEASWLEVVGRAVSAETINAANEERAKAYAQLHKFAAMVRITATSEVADAAEAVLFQVRRTQTAVSEAFQLGTAAANTWSPWNELEAAFADARDRFVETIRSRRSEKR
jgi:hypothetical protein